MDILVSSNVERLLFELSEHNGAEVAALMKKLSEDGSYTVSESMTGHIKEVFSAGCDDAATLACIRRYFNDYGYLPDTHTAVALAVLDEYRRQTDDTRPTVVAATASPFKFAPDVLKALTGEVCAEQRDSVARLSAGFRR